eukprot:6177460-Pleurochrysis_carterae.AAC.2
MPTNGSVLWRPTVWFPLASRPSPPFASAASSNSSLPLPHFLLASCAPTACVCVCVCARACVCVRVHARACVHVCA